MQNKLLLLITILLLNGCSILPGMQNINTSSIPVQNTQTLVRVEPIIKPITATYLLQHPVQPYVYRIAPQDVLSVTVWNHAEINSFAQPITNNAVNPAQSAGVSGYLVNQAGDIYFPLIGNLRVADKTPDEARALITRKLSFYLRRPQVFVRVADYRSKKIYVMGEVIKPGFLPLNDQPLSITDAINQAGSLDPNASDPRHIYVIRGEITRPEIYWLNAATPDALLLGERFKLKDNDIVVVSTSTVTRWNRFLNQLLPTLETAYYTKAITRN